MKLSSETLAVLEDFVSINASMEFKTGNKLATISQLKRYSAEGNQGWSCNSGLLYS
jgi:hypothetical protein